VETGVARLIITDWDEYADSLERRILGKAHQVTRSLQQKARAAACVASCCRRAARRRCCVRAVIVARSASRSPCSSADPERVKARANALGIDLGGDIEIFDPAPASALRRRAVRAPRARRGVTPHTAHLLLKDPAYLGVMMLHMGDADGLVCGLNRSYPETIRPHSRSSGCARAAHASPACTARRPRPRPVLRGRDGQHRTDRRAARGDRRWPPTIAQRYFDVEPRVAMLSFGNFGSVDHPSPRRWRSRCVSPGCAPDLVIDGEMAPDTALVPEIVEANFPQSLIRATPTCSSSRTSSRATSLVHEAGAAAGGRRDDRPARPHGPEQAGQRAELLLQHQEIVNMAPSRP
jgi:malate dehydrogenase (oxaloacetate-decarboxylating)(NADP+)